MSAPPRRRVLVLAAQVPCPPRGGAALRSWGLLRLLGRAHEVTLAAFETPGADLERLRALAELVVGPPPPGHTPGDRLRALVRGEADLARRLRSATFGRIVEERLRTSAFDVAHLSGLEMAPYLELLRPPLFRGAVIYDAYNVEHLLQARAAAVSGVAPSGLYSRLQARRLRRLEAEVCRRVDHVVCVSPPDAAALRALVPGLAPTVLPNGIDVEDYAAATEGVEPDADRLVFTGTMDFRPNADAVLWFVDEILPRIRAVHPRVTFFAVGQRPGARLLHHDGRNGVTVAGAVDDVRPFLARAGVVVAPLRFGSGTRVKLLEAMACARPIVATSFAAEGLAVRDGRELLIADSAPELARAVLALLAEPARAGALGRAGQALARDRYDWARIAPALLDLYARAATRGRSVIRRQAMTVRPPAPLERAASGARVSLVTTVRNEEDTIADLIRSVDAQSRIPDEWIVTDGGSTDRTVEILRGVPGCRVLPAPGNIAHGRNVALAQASGDVVVVTDAGCRLAPNFVERIIAPLDRGEADIAVGRTRPRIRTPLEAAQWTVMDQFVVDGGWWRQPALSTRALALRPEVWKDCPYPELLDFGEDAWVIEEWRRRGFTLAVARDAEVEWYLPVTWRAFARQGFRYMRADGHAGMWPRRHALRTAFYGGLASLAWMHPLIPAALWGLYLAATGIRLPLATRGRATGFRLRAAAWLPPLLLTNDVAKLAGYWTGRLERRLRRELRALAWSPPHPDARTPRAARPAAERPPHAATVAVAIVHYHAEDMLRRCLHALAASKLSDFEACVVDNGSGDGLAWAEKLDSRIRVATLGRNLGFAAGTNLALRHLDDRTPYIVLLNPDVFVEPATLADAVAAFDDASIGIVSGRLLRPDGHVDHACHRSEPELFSAFARQLGLDRLFPRSRRLGAYARTYEDPERPCDVDSGTAAFLGIRRSILERIGPCLDERFFLYGEDLDLCRRARDAGFRVVYRPHVTAVHVKGSGRIRNVHATLRFYQAMWTYYRKWGRHRRHPIVLGPLLAALAGLGAVAVVRNALRASRWRRASRDAG